MRRSSGIWGSRGRTQRPRSTSSLWPGTTRRTGACRKGGRSACKRKLQQRSSASCKRPRTRPPSWRNLSRRRRGRCSSYRRKPRASSPLKTWRRGLRSASTNPATTILPLTRKGGWPSKVSCLEDLAGGTLLLRTSPAGGSSVQLTDSPRATKNGLCPAAPTRLPFCRLSDADLGSDTSGTLRVLWEMSCFCLSGIKECVLLVFCLFSNKQGSVVSAFKGCCSAWVFFQLCSVDRCVLLCTACHIAHHGII